jgi:hypothetical protein
MKVAELSKLRRSAVPCATCCRDRPSWMLNTFISAFGHLAFGQRYFITYLMRSPSRTEPFNKVLLFLPSSAPQHDAVRLGGDPAVDLDHGQPPRRRDAGVHGPKRISHGMRW